MEKKTKEALFDEAIESSKQAINDASQAKKEGSVFETLCKFDCSPFIQYRGSQPALPYLPWASAWGIVKRLYPDANYSVRRGVNDAPYLTDGKTCWVETTVIIEGVPITDIYPVYSKSHKALSVEVVTMQDVNDALKRSLTKCIAMHGLGLYLYGDDGLPEKMLDSVLEKIEKTQSVDGLNAIYKKALEDNEILRKAQDLITACSKKKAELLKTQNNGNDEDK